MRIQVHVSPGEAIDKLTILRIKAARITDTDKLSHVRREAALLSAALAPLVDATPALATLSESLRAVNEQLWDLEDTVRALMRDREFGPRFVTVACAIHETNDRRAALKAEINALLQTDIAEQKSYAA